LSRISAFFAFSRVKRCAVKIARRVAAIERFSV